MRDQFWSLPGPRQVLARMAVSLLGGESIVLRLPPWAPDLIDPLARRLPAHRNFHLLDDSASDGRPPEALVRETLNLEPGETPESCAPAHADPIVAVQGTSGDRVRSWVRHLRRHNHATRDCSGAARLLLVLPAGSAFTHDDAGAAPVVDWKELVGRLDMYLYAAELWSHRDMGVLERDLCVALTRELAGWCPELAERFSTAGPEAAFNPMPTLTCMARERGWNAETVPRWDFGTQDRRDGIALCHAALVAARGDAREVSRRLWRAQIEVLFPIVEQIRAALATRYPELLRDVADQVTGLPRDPMDVDVGPLASRLVNGSGVSRSHRRLAAAIRDLRRPLAHLEPVSRAAALHPALIEATERALEI